MRFANKLYLIIIDAIIIFFEIRALKELIIIITRSRVKKEVLTRLFELRDFRKNRTYNLL